MPEIADYRQLCYASEMTKRRLDVLLTEKGLVESRSRAQALIMAGKVRVAGQAATKPGVLVSVEADLSVVEDSPYVSRGGLKLAAALTGFDLDPTGAVCADVGASTGGFTDVLLQRGAAYVYAIDVGYGQLAWKLRQDKRVVVLERTNARYLESLPEPIDLAVIDVSFISLNLILPVVVNWLKPTGLVAALVKPQFEAGPEQVGKGGVVRDPAVHRQVLAQVITAAAAAADLVVFGLLPSPITGPAGNHEFLLGLCHPEVHPALSTDIAIENCLALVNAP
jgi:23S rRNA (cytidine1920-2'-O)/16S rRNA (cytidine1409-2'-O)-methyltransferase